MSNLFQELQQRFQNLSRLTGERGNFLEQGTSTLQQWIEENVSNLVNWSKTGEFNGTMFQWFHWYIPPDGNHWDRLKEEAPKLAKAGITAVWLPPAYKGNGGGYDVGYGVYDLFDLGEFEQKGSIRTKYGTRDELLAAVKEAKDRGLQIYADIVFNHKMGGDEPEDVRAIPLDWDNRNQVVGDERTIQAWTHFTFPGRGDRYSSMQWHWWHFDAVDYDGYNANDRRIFRFKDKKFDSFVELEKGNYDYLMGCDLDMEHEEVKGELKYWGEWFLDTVGVDGFRFDAIKHTPSYLGFRPSTGPHPNEYRYISPCLRTLIGKPIIREGFVQSNIGHIGNGKKFSHHCNSHWINFFPDRFYFILQSRIFANNFLDLRSKISNLSFPASDTIFFF